MTGIVTTPLAAVRMDDTEKSEMISQLLFGERVKIVETKDRWLFVQNLSDSFSGWVDRKMVKYLSAEQAEELSCITPYCVSTALLFCKNQNKENVILPGGSLLPAFANNRFTIADEQFTIESSYQQTFSECGSGEHIIALAKQYLNAPYLWGGKSIFGIDCSGLIQVVFSIAGIFLPRNSSQQVEYGEVIDFLSEAKAGDLAFFENEDGKIIHGGILLNSGQIIHASGTVKIDNIDYQGITSPKTGEYTYKLRIIKRII